MTMTSHSIDEDGDSIMSDCLEMDPTPAMDEALYSRQLYVLGHEAMYKMQNSSVLVVGVSGLGMEIAKNVILAGVKSIGLHDNSPVTIGDLSAGFYFSEQDVGKPRASSCIAQLAELNRYVPVTLESEPLSTDLFSKYSVVIVTGETVQSQITLNSMCRACGAHFISADVLGVVGSIFVDLGPEFEVSDVDGEVPVRGLLSNISQCESGIVTVYDDSRHGLTTGDMVTFEELEGMSELNDCKPMPIKYIGPYSFSIGDTTSLSKYSGGGYFRQVKMPARISFKPLSECVDAPEIVFTDFGKLDSGMQLHVLSLAVSDFRESFSRFPAPHSVDDNAAVLNCAKSIASVRFPDLEIDQALISKLGRCCASQIAPMTSFIGGVAAQEVLKSCSGKFSPIRQFMYFDARECIPNDLPYSDFSPLNSRFDSQIGIFGKSLHEEICRQNTFLVGAGAIGCEMLKNWALMGVASAPGAKIVVTDMDTIEKSNLNRQFLFRDRNVGQLKSEAAAQATKAINPLVNIEAHANRVGTESENVYTDSFWEGQNVICTALDNVSARLYVDSRCVYFKKPLLESGTLGTKGNTQIVVPCLTQNYGATRDPVEQGIPVCTLKNFPNKIDHTIQWARDAFEGIFAHAPAEVNSYLSNADYLKELDSNSGTDLESLKTLKTYLVDRRPSSFEDCVFWARLFFDEKFNHSIRQLLFNFPSDSLTSTGTKFWSGPKRAPLAIEFDETDPLHLQFVTSTAVLLASLFGIQATIQDQFMLSTLKSLKLPAFVPKQIKIASSEEELKEQKEANEPMDYEEEVAKLSSCLPSPESMAGLVLVPLEFEKDDDSNFHMDFVVSCSNLRARNYRIKEESKHETKRIAGKIIPAIATTTALVSGLICLEMYKLMRVEELTIEDFRSAFVNLAIPFFSMAEPMPTDTTTIQLKGKDWSWSQWDFIEVDIGDVTLEGFLKHIETSLGLKVTMLSYKSSMPYSEFGNKKVRAERMKMRFVDVIEIVSKKTLEPSSNYIVLEACVMDADYEDVEIPPIRFKYK